jgi:hypothetical protein
MPRFVIPAAAALLLCGTTWAAAQANPPQPSAPQAVEAAPPQQPSTVGVAPSSAEGATDYVVPGATRQTVPSTISAENAKLDKLPILSRSFPLTAEQKQTIYAAVAKAPGAPAPDIKTKVTEVLPPLTPLQAFPQDVTAQIPDAASYRYVKLSDRVLLVNPTSSVVIGDIRK